LRLQAYFDAEVDAVTAADIETHMEGCLECRTLYEALGQLHGELQRKLPQARAPQALRARLIRTLDEEDGTAAPPPRRQARADWRTRSFWVGASSGLGIGAIAATLALWLLMPPLAAPLVDEVVGAHVSSLMSTHLIDVVSTDQHTVKPWFAGHTEVSPIVADFDAQGYRLVGGRVDYLEHQRAAVVVYRHGPHVINVFSWAATRRSLPGQVTRHGYHAVFWQVGDLQYCAVSDTSWDELLGLVRLLRDLGARDAR
jgi:anti-sigma factor RsiW